MNSSFSLGGLLRRPEAGALLGLLAVLIFFGIFGGLSFLKIAGLSSWLNVAATLGIIAIPVGLLMIAGELDISVGAMVPAGAMTTAIIAGHWGMSIWLAIAACLAFGVIVGLVNGLMVIRTNVPSLIVTLGSLFAVQGMVLALSVLVTKSTSVALKTEGLAKTIFGDFVFGQFQVICLWWFALGSSATRFDGTFGKRARFVIANDFKASKSVADQSVVSEATVVERPENTTAKPIGAGNIGEYLIAPPYRA